MLDFTSQFKKTLKNSQMTHFHYLNSWTQERKNAAFFLKPPEILFLFYLKTDSEEKKYPFTMFVNWNVLPGPSQAATFWF